MDLDSGPIVKRCKIVQHQKIQQKQYSGEEIVFCAKDFPHLVPGDILEIFNPDEDVPRLLLKVGKRSIRDECISHKDALSVEQSIMAAFQLKPFSDVLVKKVIKQNVELDSVELTFKDQYLGRSEMWRLKNSLVDSCLYIGKKIEFASSIRCQVHELWSHGDKVACGIIIASTKIVFRSSTSMVYLFIQMSSEMWEFDIYGDLYFEKAVNGFLAELFAKWKKTGSNHEVTIVLFSRLYYEAISLDQFPDSLRLCLQTDYKGRFYEDYYRIAVQNGKYDDWGNNLILLKHIFVDYQKNLLNLHKKGNPSVKLPKCYISTASRGNFLEVLNMSLNVFEKHYKDRSFDRTGQLSVVITPGVGVFEVDRDLTNVTMQRIIDNGVGSDLVCVGEQPLHAVPLLLKFTNKLTSQSDLEDYSMPHWINLSFYSTNKKVGYSSYIPRIKFPMLRQSTSRRQTWDWSMKPHCRIPKLKQEGVENPWPNSVYDLDDYDHKIFQTPTSGTIGVRSQPHRRNVLNKKRTNPSEYQSRFFMRQNSEPEIHQSNNFPTLSPVTGGFSNGESARTGQQTARLRATLVPPSPAITIPSKKMAALNHHLYSSSFGALNIEIKSKVGSNSSKENWLYDDIWSQKPTSPGSSSLQSASSPNDKTVVYTKQPKEVKLSSKALINPFDPSHAVIKLTSSRRRWTHIFPRGPTGTLIQQHHRHSTHSALEIVHEGVDSPDPSPTKSLIDTPTRSGRNSVTKQASVEGKLTLMWGATGEQEWTPALQTGVDWKSLTIPACLPLTTDYFPDERSMDTDYVVSAYSLLPDDVNAEYAQQRVVYRPPLNTVEVFAELVSQRLAQGFQLVVLPAVEEEEKGIISKTTNSSLLFRSTNQSLVEEEFEEYVLSIGRVFHKIQLDGSNITVIRYRPKHAYPSLKFHYTYRLNSPNSADYEASAAVFSTEKLENYSWNYLDHYICTRGDRGYALHESLKFWRFRMYLLPNAQASTKRILEGSEHTNVYTRISEEENRGLVGNFLKFVEGCVNRLRRAACKKPRAISTTVPPTNSPFVLSGLPRDRIGSASMRPRPKSGIKDFVFDGSDSSVVAPLELPVLEFNFPESLPNSITEFFQQGQMGGVTGTEEVEEPVTLAATTSGRGILEAMCLPNSGFIFVKSDDLPHWTFVSADAVHWLVSHVEGTLTVADAIGKFEEMLQDEFICHASGNFDTGFIYGFYLYSIRCFAKDGDNFRHLDLEMFQDDWLEVEVFREKEVAVPDLKHTATVEDPNFEGLDCGTSQGQTAKDRKTQLYKRVYLDVDLGKKSDRQEWGHLLYQDSYKAEEAFELVVQWVQSTGSIITELIQGWSRKAQQCSMQLVPIPSDPFAVSSSTNSDSLRGPIFIPLEIDGYHEGKTFVFEDFPEDRWPQLMFEFQEGIASQFGFISCLNPCTEPNPNYHFVHLTGNMFVFIQGSSNANISETDFSLAEGRGRRRYDSPALIGSQDDFITRHVSGKKKDGFLEDTRRVGFLWSWNYMLSKRWKTSSTPALGDENFMMKMLKDFQAFCSNQDNRLKIFWESIYGNVYKQTEPELNAITKSYSDIEQSVPVIQD